jgi:hypothetical protein
LALDNCDGDRFDVHAASKDSRERGSGEVACTLEFDSCKSRTGFDELLNPGVGDVDGLDTLRIATDEDTQSRAECKVCFCDDFDD